MFIPEVRTSDALIREINETRVPYGTLAIWFLGQMSVVVKGDDTIVYIDPYLADAPYRRFAPPFRPEEAVNADCVLITHEHIDHLDPDTIPAMAGNNNETVFVAPGCCQNALAELGVQSDRRVPAKTGDWQQLNKLRYKPIPAAHEELEYDPELDHRFVGYMIQLNGVTLYHAGDTTIYSGLLDTVQAEKVDCALLPINGRDPFRLARGIVGNMSFREAAELAVSACIDTVIPMHYDMFEGNTEHPGYFVDYLYTNYPTQKSHVMARFERYVYVSARAFK
ncbi:L-ascorbate metabolism protein UlaG (beta-lactamase superfamily) [Paenibacillus taihuensis]|uniref:L-ascorbate metabolism protein UlaG (Beta-lactamase superfamily) n=1 Tax=Paenibacillus taihuensis TaxID=1156355 RepID=A0A3D9PYY2_9BACL|nr:MBL fold metallo-hydrolase [Paenibacillus taihuensis]REE55350.1 L-ascorbate metabolism protein UlaG (beta-lactamase superfamily) [Paenibacillus taihuensis]